MPSVEAYLDQICGKLAVNPALAEDIREELRGHLEDAIASSRAAGASPAEAAARALAQFGQGARLAASLDEVHRPECIWALRLKGAAVGLPFGSLLALLLPFLGRPGLFSDAAGPHLLPLLNGALMGACAGSLAASRGGLFVGWLLGSVVWLLESTVCWVTGAMTDTFLLGHNAAVFDGLLLSPLLGGLFTTAVGLVAAALLSLTSRPRPESR